MNDSLQGNSPEARTETGEIKDQTQPTISQETKPQTETKVAESTTEKPAEAKPAGGSLLNEEAPGAPDAYADFTAPEGYELDKTALTEAAPIFKELNLSQDQAQKLVDFYAKKTGDAINKPYQDFLATRKAWVDEVKADKDIGPKLGEVRTTIGRALDSLGDPALVRGFREVMDLTGAGDHPAFVKAFYKLAQQVTEGKAVTPGKPAPVSSPNGRPRSAAQALFPELPSSATP